MRKKVLISLAIVAVLVLSAVAVWLQWGGGDSGSLGAFGVRYDTDNDFTRKMRLLGVRPDGGEETFDPDGRRMDLALPTMGEDSQWQADHYCREFIVEVPSEDPPPVWDKWVYLTDCRTRAGLGGSQNARDILTPEGKTLRSIAVSFPASCTEYRRLGPNRLMPVEKIDLKLTCWRGRRGPAVFTFTGPFQKGREYQAQNGEAALSVQKEEVVTWSPSNKQTTVRIKCLGYNDLKNTLAYDSKGNRMHVGESSMSAGLQGSQRDVIVFLPASEISAITVGEVSSTITFTNVTVAYPGRAPTTHPAWIDKTADALGVPRTGDSIRNYHFKDVAEAMKVLDVARGNALEYAVDKLTNADWKSFTNEDLERLHAAATAFSSGDDRQKHYSVLLGVKGNWPEFFSPALKIIRGGDPRQSYNVARLLVGWIGKMDAQQLAQVRDASLERPCTSSFPMLMYSLARTPAARDMILEMAKDDRPWVWISSLRGLHSASVEDVSKIWPGDRNMRVRVAIASGNIPGAPPDIRPAAIEMLPDLLRPELLSADSEAWMSILKMLCLNCGRPAATAAIVKHLQETRDFNAQEWAQKRVVRYLNLWYDEDFGGLGFRANTDNHMTVPDWPALVEQIAAWYKDNQPTSLPAETQSGTGQDQTVTFEKRQGEYWCLFDFDAGKLVVEDENLRLQGKERDDWRKSQSLDAMFLVLSENMTINRVAALLAPIPSRRYAAADENYVLDCIDAEKTPGDLLLEIYGGLPATFAFKTDKNSLGVAQIISYVPGKSMTMRYRIIRQAGTMPATAAEEMAR